MAREDHRWPAHIIFILCLQFYAAFRMRFSMTFEAHLHDPFPPIAVQGGRLGGANEDQTAFWELFAHWARTLNINDKKTVPLLWNYLFNGLLRGTIKNFRVTSHVRRKHLPSDPLDSWMLRKWGPYPSLSPFVSFGSLLWMRIPRDGHFAFSALTRVFLPAPLGALNDDDSLDMAGTKTSSSIALSRPPLETPRKISSEAPENLASTGVDLEFFVGRQTTWFVSNKSSTCFASLFYRSVKLFFFGFRTHVAFMALIGGITIERGGANQFSKADMIQR